MPAQQNRTDVYDTKFNKTPPKLQGKRVSEREFQAFLRGDLETQFPTRIAGTLPLALILGLSGITALGNRKRKRKPTATQVQ
jgi:hypothetical protein